MEADMRRRCWVALAFTIPITVIAEHVPGLSRLVHPPLASWLGLALSTPVVWWCGWIFLSGSYWALKRGKLDMSVLIATGVLAGYLSSVYLTVVGQPTAFYEAAAMLVTFVLFGHWMEMRSRRGTSDALRALFDLVPPTARVVRGGVEATDVDEGLVTGESRPVRLLAIPVAAGVFYAPFGWSLRPEISALLMSASSIIVALNAVSPRRAKI